jgi:CBS-domain-containing membrane protein
MKDFFKKMRGYEAGPPRLHTRKIARGFVGALIAIGAAAYLSQASGVPLVLGSFGASCVLLFSFPDSPFSQPRNVIGGHFLASLTGLVFLAALGSTWWSMALALATAISVMHFTRTVHPPAGSNPVIIMLAAPGWEFLFTPTLLGACILIAVALAFNNIDREARYPRHWI